MAIACVDWREAGRDDLAIMYGEEIRRWSTVLGWETASSWDHIELGRVLGTVPGLLAVDSNGAIVGWTFYLLHRGALQIGGLVADSEAATRALVDGVFASVVAGRAESITLFVFPDAPGLPAALAGRGLTVGAYDYLSKPLPDHAISPLPHLAITRSSPHQPITALRHHPVTRSPHHAIELRRWQASDGTAVAALLAAAYPGENAGRPFAPGGTDEEWREYVGQLVSAAGCGTMMADACHVVPGGADRVSGVVLVTRLSAATAHIAQLAVDPRAQRTGLGRLLVDAACATASAADCDRITLLVDGRNIAARQLYEASGFHAVARFVSAGSRQPVRLISVARERGVTMRP